MRPVVMRKSRIVTTGETVETTPPSDKFWKGFVVGAGSLLGISVAFTLANNSITDSHKRMNRYDEAQGRAMRERRNS